MKCFGFLFLLCSLSFRLFFPLSTCYFLPHLSLPLSFRLSFPRSTYYFPLLLLLSTFHFPLSTVFIFVFPSFLSTFHLLLSTVLPASCQLYFFPDICSSIF